jgi:erythritol transport system ATP-binding protein
VTVFRDGALVTTELMANTDTTWIVRQMVGRDPNSLFQRADSTPGEVILDVRNLTAPGPVRPVVHDVSLTVRAGEVVGIYGLMGAGRTELMECLMGSRAAIAGEVHINGKVESKATVQSRIKAGLALVPEDRQRDGLVQSLSVKDNVVLSILGKLTRAGILSSVLPRRVADKQVKDLNIRIPGLSAPVTSLSGGNQQKVVLGRALLTEPKLLLLDEPTRGIDVGAKADIQRKVADLAREGLAVVFISSELEEVLRLAQRIVVMRDRRQIGRLDSSDTDIEGLINFMANEGQGSLT